MKHKNYLFFLLLSMVFVECSSAERGLNPNGLAKAAITAGNQEMFERALEIGALPHFFEIARSGNLALAQRAVEKAYKYHIVDYHRNDILERLILTGNLTICKLYFRHNIFTKSDITNANIEYAKERFAITGNRGILDFLEANKSARKKRKKGEEVGAEEEEKKGKKRRKEECRICFDETTKATGPLTPMKQCPAKIKHVAHKNCFLQWKQSSECSDCIFCGGTKDRPMPAAWEEEASAPVLARINIERQREILASLQRE